MNKWINIWMTTCVTKEISKWIETWRIHLISYWFNYDILKWDYYQDKSISLCNYKYTELNLQWLS